MSTLNVDTWKSGDGLREFAPCTAWVNFDGTGTVAIRDQLNVSSVTDLGIGLYQLNFSTSMTSTNYTAAGGAMYVNGSGVVVSLQRNSVYPPLTTSLTLIAYEEAGGAVDREYVDVTIHGGI